MSVIKAIEFPDKEFATKLELFKYLKENKDLIVSNKKANKTKSAPWKAHVATKGGEAIKGLDGMEDGFIYPIINTTKIMDSHNDVHADGIWDKSLNEAGANVVYAQNHDLSIGSIIGFQKDVTPFVQMVAWKDIGESFEGSTQALTYKVKVHDSAPTQAKAIIEDKIPIQNSVRMQYVKMSLAVLSDDADMKEENATFGKHIDTIANKELVKEQGYFWLQTEAKVIEEGSMVVRGSNSATPITYPTKDIQPPSSTDNNEPSQDTQNTSDDKASKLSYKNYI